MVDKLEAEIEVAAVDLIVDLCGPGASQSGTNVRVVEDHLRQFARTLSTPTEDARERVKVLEEARKSAKALRDAAARSVKSGHRQAHLNLEMMAVALDRIDTALGNKETDRHG